MNEPLVSISINNYNYGRFLQKAIDSALNQTYPHTEVIVVDDGSTDSSREVIASYGDRVIPILKENGGQGSAFNAGYTVSRGEIVIFLDADDYLFSLTVERVVAAWKAGAAKVQYRLKLVDAFGCPLGELNPPRERMLDSGEVWRMLLEKGSYETAVTSGNAFSRAALDQIFPVPEEEFPISADSYLVTLVPFYGQVVSIQEPLGAYRVHGHNFGVHGNNLVNISARTTNSDGIHESVRYDLKEQALLVRKASELGYRVPDNLSARNYWRVMRRITSLRLDPQKHPVPSDRSLSLVYWGLRAIWRYSRPGLNRKRQLLFSAWLIWVGVLPFPLAKLAMAVVFARQSRPRAVDWVLKRTKSLLV